MNRAERRHQERRIKARWLRRLLRLRRVMGTNTWWTWAVRYASIRAHHNRCPCDTCTGFHQRIRRRDIKLAREEARRVVQAGGEE